jgi:hypothetical protein
MLWRAQGVDESIQVDELTRGHGAGKTAGVEEEEECMIQSCETAGRSARVSIVSWLFDSRSLIVLRLCRFHFSIPSQ